MSRANKVALGGAHPPPAMPPLLPLIPSIATPSYHGKTLLVRWNQRAGIIELKSTTTSVKGLMVAHSYCSNGTLFSHILVNDGMFTAMLFFYPMYKYYAFSLTSS